MNLPTENFGDIVVVHTPQELGEDNAESIEEFLTSLDRSKVIVDLDGTESIDSVGLTTLLEVQQRLRDEEGDLKIATTNNVNQKIMEVTRLDQQLEVFETVIEAVTAFV